MESKHLQIEKIERLYRVKVLYACLAGSRSWGLESPYSDNDLGLIYYRPQESYISLSEKSDTINLAEQTEFDGFGWDLKKVLQSLLNSNAVLFDWLQATTQYVSCPFTMKKLETIAQQCFDGRKVIFHYLGLSNNLLYKYKEKEDIQIKAYILLIRSTLAAMWVKEKGSPPPVLFSELLSIAEDHPKALLPIHKIMMLKKQAKPDKYVPKILILDQFIKDNQRDCSIYAETLATNKEQPVDLTEKLFHDVIFQTENREASFDAFISPKEKEV